MASSFLPIDGSGKNRKIGGGAQNGAKRWRPIKICRICGDTALGFNFNVVACGSCKAFFRRSHNKGDELECPYSNDCVINSETRKQCAKCRLNKCLQLGMKMEGEPAGQRVLRNDSSNQNNVPVPKECCDIQRSNNYDGIIPLSSGNVNDDCIIELNHFLYDSQFLTTIITTSNDSNTKYFDLSIRGCQLPLVTEEGAAVEDSSISPVVDSSSSDISTINVTATCCRLPLISPSFMPLLEMKYAHLEELMMANEEQWKFENLIRTQTTSPIHQVRGTCAADFSQEDFLRLAYHLFGGVVKQHRRLRSLRTLPIFDQVTLLQRSTSAIVMIRSVVKHDPSTGQTDVDHPGGARVNDDMTRRITDDYYEQLRLLKALFPGRFRQNDTIMVILSALALFNPALVIMNKEQVQERRTVYLNLLESCLENMVGKGETQERAFNQLIVWMDYLSCWVARNNGKIAFDLEPATLDFVRFSVPKYR